MNQKSRKHPICEKLPIIAIILAIIIPSVVVSIGSGIGEGISYNAGMVGTCVAAVLMMLLFHYWFFPEFRGFVRPEISVREICSLMIPFGIYLILSLLEPLFLRQPFYFHPTVRAVFMGFAAGFGEETMFRILALAIIMRYVKKEKRFAAVIILTLIFGLSHAANLAQGADPTMTVVQMFHATLSAFFLSAIYLRTGSVVFPIFAHGIYDYICFVTDPKLSEEGILTQQYSTWQIIVEICIVLIIGIAGIYMLRKARFADVNEVWDKKWSQMTGSRS